MMFSYRTLEITPGNGDIVGPWKNNFDIFVTAKTIGNAEVIVDKNIWPFWALNEGTPIVMNVEWVIKMMILNIDRGLVKNDNDRSLPPAFPNFK